MRGLQAASMVPSRRRQRPEEFPLPVIRKPSHPVPTRISHLNWLLMTLGHESLVNAEAIVPASAEVTSKTKASATSSATSPSIDPAHIEAALAQAAILNRIAGLQLQLVYHLQLAPREVFGLRPIRSFRTEQRWLNIEDGTRSRKARIVGPLSEYQMTLVTRAGELAGGRQNARLLDAGTSASGKRALRPLTSFGWGSRELSVRWRRSRQEPYLPCKSEAGAGELRQPKITRGKLDALTASSSPALGDKEPRAKGKKGLTLRRQANSRDRKSARQKRCRMPTCIARTSCPVTVVGPDPVAPSAVNAVNAPFLISEPMTYKNVRLESA